MRFYLMFGITAVLALIIYFYNPYSNYLGVYDNDVCIEYNYSNEGYKWIYIKDDNINIEEINDSKWTLNGIKDGKSNISFYYVNDENNLDNYLYKIDYTFEFDGNKTYWIYGEGYGLLDFPNPF